MLFLPGFGDVICLLIVLCFYVASFVGRFFSAQAPDPAELRAQDPNLPAAKAAARESYDAVQKTQGTHIVVQYLSLDVSFAVLDFFFPFFNMDKLLSSPCTDGESQSSSTTTASDKYGVHIKHCSLLGTEFPYMYKNDL